MIEMVRDAKDNVVPPYDWDDVPGNVFVDAFGGIGKGNIVFGHINGGMIEPRRFDWKVLRSTKNCVTIRIMPRFRLPEGERK
jgi:hypothetical protein